MRRLRIAVVGSGISGLAAAWLLSQRHSVSLFEAEPRLGGHCHTVNVAVPGGSVAVDTGFIVSNSWTYPNFTALMDYLDQPMVETQMSFSVSMDRGRHEYCGNSLGTLIGRSRQWFDPRHWRMIADIVRFYRSAESKAPLMPDDMTLGEFLVLEGYGDSFMRRHILPMAGAIWSATPEQIAQYPVKAFVRFFANHKLFELGQRPKWRTVEGGSQAYVSKLVADGRFQMRTSSPAARVRRSPFGADVVLASHETFAFDHVVIATHAPQALALLDEPDADERSLLSLFKTSRNDVILHRDPTHMPRARRFWSAWNYRSNDAKADSRLEVTYWMNTLQKLSSPVQHFVSLNPQAPIPDHLVDRKLVYHHPVFSTEALSAQKELWSLQGKRRTWFCGAWFGSGFHEDGLQAGLAVAEELGGLMRPWVVSEPSGRIHIGAASEPLPNPLVQAAE